MKKIILYSMISIFTLSLQGQTPEPCEETISIQIDATITTVKDSTALPSDNIGNFTEGPEKNLGDNLIIFLHGLGGDELSWRKADTHVGETFKVVGWSPKYDNLQNHSFVDVWDQLDEEFRIYNDNMYPDYDKARTIVIGHSLGGMIARYMDKRYQEEEDDGITGEREFAGFATFGSSHAGAPIVDNIDRIEDYFQMTCKVMSDPFVEELNSNISDFISTETPDIINLLFGKAVDKLIHGLQDISRSFVEEVVCDELVTLGFNQLKESIAPGIGAEISPNHPRIAELSAFETQIPALAFYGIEDAPVSWREIYSLNIGVNVNAQTGEQIPWGEANEDEEYIHLADAISNELYMEYEYNTLHEEEISLAMVLGTNSNIPSNILNACNDIPFFSCQDYIDYLCQQLGGTGGDLSDLSCTYEVSNYGLAQKYYNAWLWWNDFDRQYRIIFGLLEEELQITSYETQTICSCYEGIEGDGIKDILVDRFTGSCGAGTGVDDFYCIETTETIPVYSWVDIEYPNDGVLPTYSASSFPGVLKSVEMLGSNHQQLRNDKNTKREFRRMLLDGVYGGVFKQKEQ